MSQSFSSSDIKLSKNDQKASDQLSKSNNNLKTAATTQTNPNAIPPNNNSLYNDDNNNCQRRRASSRSIKRKKFDDELVDSTSTSYPKHQRFNRYDLEFNSDNYSQETIIPSANKESITSVQSSSSNTNVIITSSKRHSSKQQLSSLSSTATTLTSVTQSSSTPSSSSSATTTSQSVPAVVPEKKKKNKRRSIVTSQFIEENNFWKPTDDLALIINVEQTNDLRKVYNGIKFSCKFSYADIEQRWRSLLYDKNVKNLALAAIRQLHSDIIQSIESHALFSDNEEELLKKIDSKKEPTLESLQELIDVNANIFLSSRTPKLLLKQWKLLKHYNLLADQSLKPLQRHESVVSFSEIEKQVEKELHEEMKNNELALNSSLESNELMRQEISQSIRKSMLEIRMLENELPKYQLLLNSITGVAPSDFDNNTYAVLRGRIVRYLMRSTEITIGRITKDFIVDVDLSLEGPSTKISRLQAVINFQSTGEFIIYNTGKRPIYIDSMPLISQSSSRIHHNSLIEFSSLKFLFLINQDLILKMRNDVLQSCK